MPAVTLPVLTFDAPPAVTPTDVAAFVRQGQCERFLRLRLAERAGQEFMDAYGVAHQRLTPLLSLAGAEFETAVEGALKARFRTVDCEAAAKGSRARPADNARVVAEARALKAGETVLLVQPRLEVAVAGWRLVGILDLLKLERSAAGDLSALVVDTKATAEVKVEHRLQVAFYRRMLGQLLADEHVPCGPIGTALLFRPSADADPDQAAAVAGMRQVAKDVLGLDDAALEVVADQGAYDQSADDLLFGTQSVARQVCTALFDEVPYHLAARCDDCLYTEFCLKWAAETDDSAVLPYLAGVDREALRRAGVLTTADLSGLKQFASADAKCDDLVPAPGKESLVKVLAATWSVGPRLDELVHRARAYRKLQKKDGTRAIGYLPGAGNSSLPSCTPDLNPNLVWVYLDAQYDYREGRVYLLGARVVGCDQGKPVGTRNIVHVTPGPPDTPEKEKQLFVAWAHDLVTAVVELAAGPAGGDGAKAAPVHVVFFDQADRRRLLEGLARNFPAVLGSTPPLYDFLTQLAAFDSPIASYLDEEVRATRNYPMTCQSLQAVATYLKFDWNQPHPFREAFKARLFDYLGKLDMDGESEWYTKRARFSSSVPLEYAYAAWGQLPERAKRQHDEFADFRACTRELLVAFQARRLEALEHVASRLPANPYTQKTPSALPRLAEYGGVADDLAHALHEFVMIERLVALADWKTARHAPPERRVLQGEALLVRYLEEDQEPGVADQNRENERRRLLRAKYEDEFRSANPGKKLQLAKAQREESKWSQAGLKIKLRVTAEGLDCDLAEALAMSNRRDGDRLVLARRWTTDERLIEAQRVPFTPTPKQMLYATRCDLARLVVTETDGAGRPTAVMAEVELTESFGGPATVPFVFGAFTRPLVPGELYTLDPCPNDWYGYWALQVVKGLCDGRPNTLAARLADPAGLAAADDGPLPGQEAFLAGLDAFRDKDLFHDFEPAKRDYIGKHGRTPVLLVQGPLGTGKSYCTAFAVFARLQAAMAAGKPLRAFVSCKLRRQGRENRNVVRPGDSHTRRARVGPW